MRRANALLVVLLVISATLGTAQARSAAQTACPYTLHLGPYMGNLQTLSGTVTASFQSGYTLTVNYAGLVIYDTAVVAPDCSSIVTYTGGATGRGTGAVHSDYSFTENPGNATFTYIGPPDIPSPPTNVTATPGNGTASVAFDPPSSTGGGAITQYTVSLSPGGIVAIGTTSPVTVPGLTLGASYQFTVTATNATGTSPPSLPSNIASLRSPGMPTNVVATAGPTSALISFTPPADPGGSPISSYEVSAKSLLGGPTITGALSPITVTGLKAGVSYLFTVTAFNTVGGTTSAPSNSVIPTESAITVSVSWTASESARLNQMAPFFNAPAAGVQKLAVYVIAYLLGFGPSTPAPQTLPAPGAAVIYVDTWQPAEFTVLDSVKNKFVLTNVDATRFSVAIVDYLLALGGR